MTIRKFLIRNISLIVALLSIVITAQLVLNHLQNRELHLESTSQAIVDKTIPISIETMQRLEYLHNVSSWLIVVFLVVISLSLYVFSVRIIKKITRPLELLHNKVRKFENGEFPKGFDLESERNDIHNTSETYALARSIDSMISHIRNNVAALQQQNTYIQTILDNIPLGVAVNTYLEGTSTYINRQFERIYGWPKEQLGDVADFFNNVYPDKDYRERMQKKVLEDINSGNPERMHWENIEITTQTGEKRIVNARNIPLTEQNLMISTVQDITEMVHLRKDRDRIFENSVDMVCTATLNGYLLTLNPAWEKVLGWSQQELKAKPFLAFIHPDDLAHTLTANKGLNEGKPALGFENRYRNKEGDYRWFSWNTIPILEENIMLGIARDITEKKENEARFKQSEEKLLRSQQQLQNITNNIPGAILQFKRTPDGEDTLIYVSGGASNIWGISPRNAAQNMKTVWKQVHRNDLSLVKASIATSYRDMSPWNIEFRNNLPGGEQRWTQGIGIPQKMNDGSVVWDSLLLDITQRKTAELKLRDYQQELRKLTTELSVTEEKHRKEVAANIHDHLSQSLVISKMKINDLLNEQQLQPYLPVLKYIKKQISEALENSRKITYDLSPPVLYEMGLVETMYWLVEKTEEESRLKMEFHTDFDALKLPEATMILLYRCIQEIIFNVIKHAKASKVSVQFLSEEEGLAIRINDNGKGFSVPGTRDKNARRGFGLFAVEERIQNLNGRFSIESTPGLGTQVKFYIPLNTNPSTNGD